MEFIFKKKRGRTSVEYAVLFAVVVAAIIAINGYLQRSFQGRFRMLGDELGTQYEPGATTVDYTTITHTETSEYELEVSEDPNEDSDETIPATHSISEVTEDRRETVEGY